MLYCHEFINADVCLVCSTSTFKSQADILKIQEVCSLAVSKVTVVEQNAEPETNGALARWCGKSDTNVWKFPCSTGIYVLLCF